MDSHPAYKFEASATHWQPTLTTHHQQGKFENNTVSKQHSRPMNNTT